MENIEQRILKLFLYENKLKFSDIEKNLGVRSNKLSYHIKNMIFKGVLEKEGEYYRLSKGSEYLIPYISEKTSVLPVILIMIKKAKKVFLVKRDKRPFKGKLALPAGRIMIGESLSTAVRRIMKEKYSINAVMKRVNSISLEHVKKDKKPLHSFILILVNAKTLDKLDYKNPIKEKKNIINSDYDLINKYSNKKTTIKEYETKDL